MLVLSWKPSKAYVAGQLYGSSQLRKEGSPETTPEKVVQAIRRKTRRRFSAEEKIRNNAGGPYERDSRHTHESGAFMFPQTTMSPEDRRAVEGGDTRRDTALG